MIPTVTSPFQPLQVLKCQSAVMYHRELLSSVVHHWQLTAIHVLLGGVGNRKYTCSLLIYEREIYMVRSSCTAVCMAAW